VAFDSKGDQCVITWLGDTAIGDVDGPKVGPMVWVAYTDNSHDPAVDLLELSELSLDLKNGTSRVHTAWWVSAQKWRGTRSPLNIFGEKDDLNALLAAATLSPDEKVLWDNPTRWTEERITRFRDLCLKLVSS